MKELLPAIQTSLKTLDMLPAESACYITPDARWRPVGVDDTCLGIMHGGTRREELAGNMWEFTHTVDLIGFVPLTADAKNAICGSSGVLQLLDDAVDVLKGTLLGLSDLQSVQIGDDRPNGLHAAQDDGESVTWLVSIIRQVIYTSERESV